MELCPDKQLVSKYRRQQDVMDSLKLRIGFSSAVQVGVTLNQIKIIRCHTLTAYRCGNSWKSVCARRGNDIGREKEEKESEFILHKIT